MIRSQAQITDSAQSNYSLMDAVDFVTNTSTSKKIGNISNRYSYSSINMAYLVWKKPKGVSKQKPSHRSQIEVNYTIS